MLFHTWSLEYTWGEKDMFQFDIIKSFLPLLIFRHEKAW
jgi:hypothetical protein